MSTRRPLAVLRRHRSLLSLLSGLCAPLPHRRRRHPPKRRRSARAARPTTAAPAQPSARRLPSGSQPTQHRRRWQPVTRRAELTSRAVAATRAYRSVLPSPPCPGPPTRRRNIRTRPSRSSMRARIISPPLRWMSIPRRTPRCATICATANSRPTDLVRVEEFVNYFKQEYPDPTEGAFSINLEGARSPFSPEGTYLLKVGLQGKHLADWQRKDASLTFVMDVSGSMDDENRIEMVKYGLTRWSINSAPTIAWRLWPSATTPGSCWNRPRSRIAIASSDAINSLHPMNSTNTEAGLRLGYELAQRYYRDGVINRVVSGHRWRGQCRQHRSQRAGAVRAGLLRPQHLPLDGGCGPWQLQRSTAGTRWPTRATATYSFLDSQQAAERIFAQDLNGTLQTIAKDAKVQVDFNPERRARLPARSVTRIAPSPIRISATTRWMPVKWARATASPPCTKCRLNPESNDDAAIVRMRYEDPDTHAVTEQSKAFKARDFQSDFNRMSPRFQLTASVAQFAEILRGNEWAKNAKMRDVLNVMCNVQQSTALRPGRE